jgi:hypothetical protein
MELRLNGDIVPVSQMGRDFIVVRQPFDHPPAEAEVFLAIDESENKWRVYLVDGISAGRRKTRIDPVR